MRSLDMVYPTSTRLNFAAENCKIAALLVSYSHLNLSNMSANFASDENCCCQTRPGANFLLFDLL